jgi:hypothetical protein
MSAIGTVANRTLRNSAGQVTKTIVYGLDAKKIQQKDIMDGPYSEDMLAVRSIQIHKYDQNGREIRIEHHTRDLRLDRIMEVVYGGNGQKECIVWLTPDERRYYEIRYRDGHATSHLYFDDAGEGLIAIWGEIPKDVDLVCGWGQPVDDLSCGIAPNKFRGRVKDICISVSVRNLADHPARLVTGIQYHIIRIELRDMDGAIVRQDVKHVDKRHKALLTMNRGPNEGFQTIGSNEAHYSNGYRLAEWYRKIRPGRYYLTIRRRAATEEFSLVSNTIEIEILPD